MPKHTRPHFQGRYRTSAITRYTLAEHETLTGFVVAVAITAKQADDVRQHTGVIFDDYAKANDAADDINDWACIAEGDGPEPLHPNRPAHLTGFSSKFRIDGRRLYKPLNTPEHAIKEKTVTTTAEKQTFHYGTWVFDIDKAQKIIAEAPRDTSLVDVDYWANAYHVDRLRPDYEGQPWAPIFGPSQIHFNRDHAMTTDLDQPLIFAVFAIGDEKQALLIDGTHRLYRARVEGREKLPAHYLTVEETVRVQER